MSGVNVLAVNIGKTYVRVADVGVRDGLYHILSRDRIPTLRLKSDGPKPLGEMVRALGHDIHGVAVGSAGPILNGECQNPLDFVLRESEFSEATGAPSTLVNDIPPQVAGFDLLRSDQIFNLNRGTEVANEGTMVAIAPGTGLGVGYGVSDGEVEFIRKGVEAGHEPEYAPTSDLEFYLMKFLQQKYGYVTQEKVLRGDAIIDILNFLREFNGAHWPVVIERPSELAPIISDMLQERDIPNWLREDLTRDDIDKSALITKVALGLDDRGTSAFCTAAQALWNRMLGLFVGSNILIHTPARGVNIAGGFIRKVEPSLLNESDPKLGNLTFRHGLALREDPKFRATTLAYKVDGVRNEDIFLYGLARIGVSEHNLSSQAGVTSRIKIVR